MLYALVCLHAMANLAVPPRAENIPKALSNTTKTVPRASLANSETITFPEAESRSYAEVCAKYNELYPRTETGDPGSGYSSDKCNVGVHSDKDKADTIRRINLFRYLSGLVKHEVNQDTKYHQQCLEATAVLAAYGGLTHYLTTEMECYTDAAKTAAASSNIAFGYSSSADSIDGYIEEGASNKETLGHRRWILHRSLAGVGIGWRHANSYLGRYGVLKVFGGVSQKNDENEIPFVACPGPGPQPINLIYNYWSIYVQGGKVITSGSVKRNDGEVLANSPVHMLDGYGESPAYRFDIDMSKIDVTHSYTVSVTLDDGSTLTYVVKPCDCSDPETWKDPDPAEEGEGDFNGTGTGLAGGAIALIVVVVVLMGMAAWRCTYIVGEQQELSRKAAPMV